MSGRFLHNLYLGLADPKRLPSYREEELGDAAQRVVDDYRRLTREFPPATLEKMGAIPPELLAELKRIGFFGLSIPTAYGGMGLSLSQYLRVVEEIAAIDLALGIISVAHLSIGIKGIVLFGTEAQKQKYLRAAASGEMIFSYALTEPRVGSDAKHIETSAELTADGKHYILNGSKTYITNANYAGGLTVFAQLRPGDPGHMGAFIVETSWPGVRVGKDMPKMGLKISSTAPIHFDHVRVPAANLLGKPGQGFKIAMMILNYGRLALGATGTGMMRQSAEDMRRRAATRKQFGRSLDQFPLIQEKIVRAEVSGYIAAAMTHFTATMLAADPLAEVAMESSHCKLFGTARAWDAAYEALQTAGGAGYLATQPYEKRMRDFRVTTIFEGTSEIHSIYPALFMGRRLQKRLLLAKTNALHRLLALVRLLLLKDKWQPRYQERVLRRAARLAAANATTIRRLLAAAIILRGQKLVEDQFFLRRITRLSLYLYGLVAAISRIEFRRRRGLAVDSDLQFLEYFLEEARAVRREAARFLPSRQERLHQRIFKNLVDR